MIMEFFNTVDEYANVVNIICHTIIFLGGFYVAIHSRVLPRWATTCIWYVGLSSFFVATTIITEWVFGQHHPFSYFMMGHVGEIIMNVNLAIMVLLLFSHTIWRDIKAKNMRKVKDDDQKTVF